MAIKAAGSQSYLAYIAETVWGTTPAVPQLVELRTTGNTLALTKEALQSEEIISNRQITDFRHGTRSVAGDITAEISHNAYDALFEAALGGTWTANILKAGTTFRSFTMERGHTDINQYLVYLGMVVNTMSISLVPNQIARVTFGMMGKDQSAPAGATIDTSGGLTASAGNEPFDSFTGTINEGGSAIATVTSLEINLDNGAENSFVIGANTSTQFPLGRSNITGTVSAFFEDAVLLNKFLNETISSIDMTLTRGANTLQISLPEIKYSGAELPVAGEGQIVMTLPFQAIYDDVQQSNIVLTRSA